jgi:hypothetical protein
VNASAPDASPATASADAGAKPVVVATRTRRVRVCDRVETYGGCSATWLMDKTSERFDQIRTCYEASP